MKAKADANQATTTHVDEGQTPLLFAPIKGHTNVAALRYFLSKSVSLIFVIFCYF